MVLLPVLGLLHLLALQHKIVRGSINSKNLQRNIVFWTFSSTSAFSTGILRCIILIRDLKWIYNSELWKLPLMDHDILDYFNVWTISYRRSSPIWNNKNYATDLQEWIRSHGKPCDLRSAFRNFLNLHVTAHFSFRQSIILLLILKIKQWKWFQNRTSDFFLSFDHNVIYELHFSNSIILDSLAHELANHARN